MFRTFIPKYLLSCWIVGMLFVPPLFGKSEKLMANLSVDLGPDTLYLCVGEPHTLTPALNGGTAPYSFLWSNGDTGAMLTTLLPLADTVTYWVRVTDGDSLIASDTVRLIAFSSCVWPGDANGDGIANHIDLLELGRAFGASGPLRPNAHTNWIGQPSPDWGHTLPGGHDYTYADTDGDGQVGVSDMLAIEKNYTFQAAVPSTQPGSGPPLSIVFPDSNVNSGDTLVAQILLGTSAIPADSIYGFAFSLKYDQALVDSGSLQVRYDSSWLGAYHQDFEAIDKDFYDQGQVDIAITRINQRSISGYGRVGDIVIMIDDIAGKNNAVSTLVIELVNVKAIHVNGSHIPLASHPVSLQVFPEGAARPEPPVLMEALVYPNPCREGFYVSPGEESWDKLTVSDLTGRSVYEYIGSIAHQLHISTEMWIPGVYTVVWEGLGSTKVQRIQVLR